MTDIEPRRLDIEPARLDRQLAWQGGRHRRFVPAQAPCPGWLSYASQRHIRAIAVDERRGWLWLATWGGVLCWAPEQRSVTRHTSEDGLAGNATRAIAVDRDGIVWAAGQTAGLATLVPDGDAAWLHQEKLRGWQVLHLAPQPESGVYAALRGPDGRCALGAITAPGAQMRLLAQGGLPCRAIDALTVDGAGAIWIGNVWGAHRYQGDGAFESFALDGAQVRALAAGADGALWLGTNKGLLCLPAAPVSAPAREDGWPHEEVLSLAVDRLGCVWAATIDKVGCLRDGAWQTVENSPPGRQSALATGSSAGRVWVGGANGLYEVDRDQCAPAFAPAPEDALSNAVQCLWADAAAVWVGTARGLHRFDGRTWRSYHAEAPGLRDIRALLPDPDGAGLWVGAWRGGLQRLEQAVYLPGEALAGPIVALAPGAAGAGWAATPDAVYHLPSGGREWLPVTPRAGGAIGPGVIQALCFQQADRATLWVGTSAGLFCYWPELELWDRPPQEFEQCPVQALALDPATNRLWIGTPAGLFSEHAWQRHHAGDVRALAFDHEHEALWVGTASGLDRWPAPGQGQVFVGEPASFHAADSGLAADLVTALAIRPGAERELWVGSPMGISCYRY